MSARTMPKGHPTSKDPTPRTQSAAQRRRLVRRKALLANIRARRLFLLAKEEATDA